MLPRLYKFFALMISLGWCASPSRSAESFDFDGALFDDIIVLPDIHGDFNTLVRSIFLAFARIVDRSITFPKFLEDFIPRLDSTRCLEPMSPNARVLLVQLGNVVGRGPRSKATLEVMSMLDQILGWRVVSLLGSEEVKAHFMIGNSKVHSVDVESFGGIESRIYAFSHDGPLWRSIRAKSGLVARVGDVLFVHAGVDPIWLRKLPVFHRDGRIDIDGLNAWAAETLLSDERITAKLLNDNSPLLTRILSESHEFILCNGILPQLQRMFKVSRIVIGHFPGESPKTRCSEHIVLADFGSSHWQHIHKGGMPGFIHVELSEGRVSDVSWSAYLSSQLPLVGPVKVKILPPVPSLLDGIGSELEVISEESECDVSDSVAAQQATTTTTTIPTTSAQKTSITRPITRALLPPAPTTTSTISPALRPVYPTIVPRGARVGPPGCMGKVSSYIGRYRR